MRKMNRFPYRLGIALLAAFLLLNACVRDHNKPVDKNKLTARDVDSLKFYTWYINLSDSLNVPLYLWNDQVPASFNWADPRYATADDVMKGIASYPRYMGKRVDHYSFIDVTGEVSRELEGGIQGDFGLMVAAVQGADDKILLFVEYTYPGSPARDAGILRGDQLVSINGKTDMDLRNKTVEDRINKALFGSESVTLKFQAPGSEQPHTAKLHTDEYHLNPVLFDTVYTVGTKKVGYFVYNTFTSVGSQANGQDASEEINNVFASFKAKGVNELIVDLRYNGGGSVATAEYMSDIIVPRSAVGQEMYHSEYNDAMMDYLSSADQDIKDYYLAPIKFTDTAYGVNLVPYDLGLNRVFFIVSKATASASELVINNLRPYMDVQIVGDTTYGKPVGFFSIPIGFVTQNRGYQEVADMYSINFKSVNSAGQTDYFFGMLPQVQLYDYVDLRWGDPRDVRLASIFHKIKEGSYLTQADFQRQHQQALAAARKAPGTALPAGLLRKMKAHQPVNPHAFDGMVDYRKKTDLRQWHK